jgi:hypothetical protein
VSDLLRLAVPGQDGDDVPGLDPLRLLDAGLRQDDAALDRITVASDPPQPVPGAIAHFAALPLLLEAARRAADAVPPGGWAGTAPYARAGRRWWSSAASSAGGCSAAAGAPPVGSATRSIARSAGSGTIVARRRWSPTRRRSWCGWRCATAATGYIKCLTTLRAKTPWALALDDLRTLPLDLTALERGYRRPEQPAWALSLAIAERSDVAAGGTP